MQVRHLQALAAENARLRLRAWLLEQVVACRHEQMALLQTFQAKQAVQTIQGRGGMGVGGGGEGQSDKIYYVPPDGLPSERATCNVSCLSMKLPGCDAADARGALICFLA